MSEGSQSIPRQTRIPPCSALSRRSSNFLINRRSHQIPPLRPRTVVDLHVVVAEQIFQHEPRVRTSLPDPAVRNNLVVARNALPAVELLQRIGRLKRSI